MFNQDPLPTLTATGIAIDTLSEEQQSALSDLSPEEVYALTKVTAQLSHRGTTSTTKGIVGGGLIF